MKRFLLAAALCARASRRTAASRSSSADGLAALLTVSTGRAPRGRYFSVER